MLTEAPSSVERWRIKEWNGRSFFAAVTSCPPIVNVEIDNESLSPFIAPYAEMVKGG